MESKTIDETSYDILVYVKDARNMYQYRVLKYAVPPTNYIFNQELQGYKYRILTFEKGNVNADWFDAILTQPTQILRHYRRGLLEGAFIKLNDRTQKDWLFFCVRDFLIKSVNIMIGTGELLVL